MSFLPQDEIVRTLLGARSRLSAGFYMTLRDVHLVEDLFQEVTVKALAQGELFTNEAQLLSWARVVGRNAALNQLRKLNRLSVGLPDALLETLEAEGAVTIESGREEALASCLQRVPPAAREMLDLRYFHGLSCIEVAQRTGAGVDAIYQKLSRLHRSLRECMEQKLALAATPS